MNENTARKTVATTASTSQSGIAPAGASRPGLARISFLEVQNKLLKGKGTSRSSKSKAEGRGSRKPAEKAEVTPKRAETKFIPCVARHFCQRTVSYGKALEEKFSSLKTQLGDYEGTQVPEVEALLGEIEGSLGPVQQAVMKLARILDQRSSKPEGF